MLDWERKRVDPENKYAADGLTIVEQNALKVLNRWVTGTVTRTRDVIQIDYTESKLPTGEIAAVALVTAEALELRMPTVEPLAPHVSIRTSKFWKRVEWSKVADDKALGKLLNSILGARRRSFRACKYCGERYPPEQRFRVDVCLECATGYEGVLF